MKAQKAKWVPPTGKEPADFISWLQYEMYRELWERIRAEEAGKPEFPGLDIRYDKEAEQYVTS